MRIPERVPGRGREFEPFSENSKANRIETMKGPAESRQICSVGRRKIAKKIAKNKRCYANTLTPLTEAFEAWRRVAAEGKAAASKLDRSRPGLSATVPR